MLIHDLTTKASAGRKRIGRGGKRGTFSGRGVKGQKARAGGTPRPQIRDFLKKLPKKRGWKQKPKPRPRTVNVGDLEKAFEGGETVKPALLEERGLLSPPRRGKTTEKVKLLGRGDLSKKLIVVSEISVSSSARATIEGAGGTIADE